MHLQSSEGTMQQVQDQLPRGAAEPGPESLWEAEDDGAREDEAR